MKKKVAILGSTGSIGTQTLQVLAHLSDEFEAVSLAVYQNIELLEEQVRAFSIRKVAVFDEAKAIELRRRLPGVQVLSGQEGLVEIATSPEVDIVVSAISGTMGIVPTIEAIRAGKRIALANKEVLVSAGEYAMKLARETGSLILPVDSEHGAIFQCLEGRDKSEVERIIITASGGPFSRMKEEDLAQVTFEQAMRHPSWSMGVKITIDSSTLMNKGLEVIEAHWLFGLPLEKIDVVIHPQSVVHSFVEFYDHSMLAQVSTPSMIIPIQYALTYPRRREAIPPRHDFTKSFSLDFFPPDLQKFPCLALAYHAQREGSTYPCYMNAANEVLVHRFARKEISWREIGGKLETLLSAHKGIKEPTLGEILSVDEQARFEALSV